MHVVTAARQLITHQWWAEERQFYEMMISQYVIDEAADGDNALAQERLALLQGLPLLPLDAEIAVITNEIMRRAILPPKATVDAIHIAIASYQQIDYLLTWSCTHIANGRTLPRIHAVLNELGFLIPYVCTPEELVNDVE